LRKLSLYKLRVISSSKLYKTEIFLMELYQTKSKLKKRLDDEEYQGILEYINELTKSSNEDEQSIAKILGSIHEMNDYYSAPFDCSVYVVGNTGSGKTTLCAFLAGVKLNIEEVQNTPGKFRYVYQDKNEKRLIGANPTESQTIFPNRFVCADGTNLWDCPGFCDSRGFETQILQGYNINMISKNSRKIKFLLVINAEPLDGSDYGDNKGESFKQLLEVLRIMIKGKDMKLSQHLTIVFSKASNNIQFYQKKMNDFYDLLMNPDGSFIGRVKKFFSKNDFSSFFDELKKTPSITFPNPQNKSDLKQPHHLLKFLGQSIYSEIDINMPVSIDSLEKIIDLWDCSREKIAENVTIVCETIAMDLKLLDIHGLYKVAKIYDSFETDYLKNPPLNNEDFVKLFEEKFIDPYMLNNYKINQTIKKSMGFIKFLAKEIYDTILSKIQLSEKACVFFGVLGNTELRPGLDILNNSMEQKYEALKSVDIPNFLKRI